MRARHATPATALALALALAAGCGKSAPTSPGPPGGSGPDFSTLINTIFPAAFTPPPSADPYAALLVTMDLGSLRGASAVFVSNLALVNAGGVNLRVNAPAGPGTIEVALEQYSAIGGSRTQYVYTTLVAHPVGVDLPFDGVAWHRFTVAGSAAYPAFVDSIRSVSPLALAAPADGAGVPRATDLAIRWSDAGTDTTVYVACTLASRVDTTKAVAAVLVLDTDGAATIGAAALGTLPAGPAHLVVSRYRLRYTTIGGHKTGLACESSVVRPLTLN